MVRYYCPGCKRVRRARSLPITVELSGMPFPRFVGECNWHSYQTHGAYLRGKRQPRTAPVMITRKVAPTPKPQPRSKKSRRPRMEEVA